VGWTGTGLERLDVELRPHDSEHGVRVPIEGNGPADQPLIAAEPSLPESMTQNHDVAAVRAIFIRRERPPMHDGRPEETEEINTDLPRRNLLRVVARGQVHRVEPIGRDVLQHTRLPATQIE